MKAQNLTIAMMDEELHAIKEELQNLQVNINT
jgi:hypothetical protein